MNTKDFEEFIEIQKQRFAEYRKETNRQLMLYKLLVVTLIMASIFFASQSIVSNNAIDGILNGHENQLNRLNESYQLQLDCLQETYHFNEDECL